jgi:hypothetical protein
MEVDKGQIWVPRHGHPKSREVTRIYEEDGKTYVRWSPFWLHCGWTQPSSLRLDRFRAWIRKHNAEAT